jgi:hypothetical protein
MVEEGPLRATFSRRKPRLISLSVSYRLFRLLRRVLPARVLGRALLQGEWILRRLALEQFMRWRPDDVALLRPRTESFIREFVPSGARVIDIAGGHGVGARVAALKAASVLFVDRNPEFVEAMRRAGLDNVEARQGDALDELERAGTVDTALVLHFLEHLEDPRDFLRRVARHCRRVLIEVPDFASDPLNRIRLMEGLPAYSDADHMTEFSVEHLQECLQSTGWDVRHICSSDGAIFAVADRRPAE